MLTVELRDDDAVRRSEGFSPGVSLFAAASSVCSRACERACFVKHTHARTHSVSTEPPNTHCTYMRRANCIGRGGEGRDGRCVCSGRRGARDVVPRGVFVPYIYTHAVCARSVSPGTDRRSGAVGEGLKNRGRVLPFFSPTSGEDDGDGLTQYLPPFRRRRRRCLLISLDKYFTSEATNVRDAPVLYLSVCTCVCVCVC